MERFFDKLGFLGLSLLGAGVVGTRFIFVVDGGERVVIFNKFRGLQSHVYGEGMHFKLPVIMEPRRFEIRSRPYLQQSIPLYISYISNLVLTSKSFKKLLKSLTLIPIGGYMVNHDFEYESIADLFHRASKSRFWETCRYRTAGDLVVMAAFRVESNRRPCRRLKTLY